MKIFSLLALQNLLLVLAVCAQQVCAMEQASGKEEPPAYSSRARFLERIATRIEAWDMEDFDMRLKVLGPLNQKEKDVVAQAFVQRLLLLAGRGEWEKMQEVLKHEAFDCKGETPLHSMKIQRVPDGATAAKALKLVYESCHKNVGDFLAHGWARRYIVNGDLESLKKIEKYIDGDTIDYGQETLLTLAVTAQNRDMVSFLFNHGANPHARDDQALTRAKSVKELSGTQAAKDILKLLEKKTKS
ncbi:MAG: ankyrin repeat domain-containing protein [Candidatus Dependentiae bacterium]|nr:ankyrin repeat domain-containing protein [Candidatus Dependentiae bacterium]